MTNNTPSRGKWLLIIVLRGCGERWRRMGGQILVLPSEAAAEEAAPCRSGGRAHQETCRPRSSASKCAPRDLTEEQRQKLRGTQVARAMHARIRDHVDE